MSPAPPPLANQETGQRRTRGRSIVVGTIVGLLGLGFVFLTVASGWDDVAGALESATPGYLALAFVMGGLGMTCVGLTWRSALRTLGAKVDTLPALRAYFVGQLGKYLPGGVWAIMGRGEWVRAEGISGSIAYGSVLLSMVTAQLSALLFTFLLLPFSGIFDTGPGSRYGLVLLLLPLGLLVLHPRMLRKVLMIASRLTHRTITLEPPRWHQSAWLVAQQLPAWLLIGVSTLAASVALGARGDALNLITATTLSWVIGFIALPTPGGIGVREAAFVALATSLPPGVAATVALVARLVFVAVDVLCAAAVGYLLQLRQRRGAIA